MPSDILILTALKEELDALLRVTGGAITWATDTDDDGLPFHRKHLSRPGHLGLDVAAAWCGAMGETAAADRARALISELNPGCIAMCGICAGRRGDVFLGDVIIADRVFSYDHGKMVRAVEKMSGASAGLFLHDIETYNLRQEWQIQAAYDAADLAGSVNWQQSRPPSLSSQRKWLLRTALTHAEKADQPSPDLHPQRAQRSPAWRRTLSTLVSEGLISIAQGELRITDRGIAAAREERLLSLEEADDDPAFRVRVGPIGTGKTVQQDPEIFNTLARLERRVLGLEMETSAIGFVAERAQIPAVIVKGVSDYADLEKDDQFRGFSGEASARVLLAFLLSRYRIANTKKIITIEDALVTEGDGAAFSLNEQMGNSVVPSLTATALVGFAIDVSGSMRESIHNSTGGHLSRLDGFNHSLARIAKNLEEAARTNEGKVHSEISCFSYAFGLQGIKVADLFTLVRLGQSLISKAEVDRLTAKHKREAEQRYSGYAGLGGLAKSLGLGSLARQVGHGLRQQAEDEVRRRVIADLADGIQQKLAAAGDTTLALEDTAKLWHGGDAAGDMESVLFGDTPMRQGLGELLCRFDRESARQPTVERKVAFILSDGASTDGDPREVAARLRSNGITIVSCFLTSHDIGDPRRLPTAPEQSWSEGARIMFDMASEIDPDSEISRFLKKKQWNVKRGARYFVQINHSAILEEFVQAALIAGDLDD